MTERERLLVGLAEEVVGVPEGPAGCVLAISTADGTVSRAHAGIARADGAAELSENTPFHIASVGKMLTATLILQLAEEGAFGSDSVDATLPALAERALVHPDLARGVHPEAERITLRHLLSHTSGMKDMQVDDASGTAVGLGRPAPDSMLTLYLRGIDDERKGRGDGGAARWRWKPWDPEHPDDPMAGHLNRFIATGTAANPVGAPGERFHYSDTAYALLGTIVETARRTPLHAVQRERALRPLGMHSTYLSGHDEPSPDAGRHEMDVWLGEVPLLSHGYSMSFDWGGGGQVSTVDDLLRLVRGVWAGTCLRDSSTRSLMLESTPLEGLTLPRTGMGLGVHHHLVGDRAVVGHSGAWGVRAFIEPATGIAVAATVSRRDECDWLHRLFEIAEGR